MSTWWGDCKTRQFFFHGGFFKSTLYILRCTWTGWINLKILPGCNIIYLSIWPFIRHPWFPTRKASKLTFICFQLQLLDTMQGLNNWSWKQTNVSFEAFLVGNQQKSTEITFKSWGKAVTRNQWKKYSHTEVAKEKKKYSNIAYILLSQ